MLEQNILGLSNWRQVDALSGRSFFLFKNQTLKITTPNGLQVADFFCVDPYNLRESFSAHQTMNYNQSIYVTTGSQLYSNRSNPMAEIIEDSNGCNDLLMPPCDFRRRLSLAAEKPPSSCLENMHQCLAPYGVSEDTIGGTLHFFMSVKIDSGGVLQIEPSKAQPFDYVKVRARRDLLVGLTSCSHTDANNGQFAPIYYEIMHQD